MKKLIPTALIAVLLLFMGYAGYRYYTEEVKPIEDLKKDMAEQRKLFDSIRPEAMPFDFSTEPETAPPLPTDGFYSPEELAEIYGIEPPSEILPSSENPETVAVPQTVTIVETPESPEIQPETEQLPDFDELPPIPDPPIETAPPPVNETIPQNPIETVPPPVNETIPQNPIETVPPPINETTPINTTAPEVTEPETATPTQQPEESPLEEVKEVNRQAIAWLTIPDTDLDYPIAQADDNEFYLWKGFNGLRNGTGTPFLDYRCKPDFSGYNSIIYGHNMEQMLMFATIRLYRDKSFMEEHPEGWLLLDDGLHKIQFFAFLSVQSDSAIYQTVFASPQEFEEYKDLLFDLAKYTMNVPEKINHVILLSTCTFERENQRGIVVGNLN